MRKQQPPLHCGQHFPGGTWTPFLHSDGSNPAGHVTSEHLSVLTGAKKLTITNTRNAVFMNDIFSEI